MSSSRLRSPRIVPSAPRMPALFTLAILTLIAARQLPAESISIQSDDWQITADSAHSILRIEHSRLGLLLDNVRLNLRQEQKPIPLKNWSPEKLNPNVLRIRTTAPLTQWTFEILANTLKISSTSDQALITATAPATKDRIVARTLDSEGAPVNWTGTREVANGYDGSETRNPSFLPGRNPEVMYFALGQVSGNAFHSLFDRRSDTAIAFDMQTIMQRNPHNQDLLDLAIPVPGNALIRVLPDYFTKTLGVPYYTPFDDSYFKKAPMVWSSWTSYYAEVTENDIVRNADWLADHLKPYGFEYVQLDDGYDRGKAGEHYWIENWDRTQFPHGPQWLTAHIKSQGLRAGIWLVPNAYAGAVKEHPDWYVHDKQGKLILDYKTPALDSTNPAVMTFLKKLFTTLDNWGFEYYKFDGEHAFPKYVPAVDRARLYDPAADPLLVYRNRLKLIRGVVGPEVFIEGCPAGTPLNGIGYFDSYFNGDDVYNSWQGMYPLFSSINANAFLNHLAIYVMPGEGMDIGPYMTATDAKLKRNPTFLQVAETREKPLRGFGTTLPEARTLVTMVALSGVVYPLSSVLPELPPERVNLLKMSLPTMPILPIDLFSRGTDMTWDKFKHEQPDFYIHNYPEVLDLKVNAASGVYDVVGLTDWRSQPLHKELSFADKLGLSAAANYVIYDYWNQKPLGVFRDRIDLDIAPHDTRVLLIHPLMPRPQLIGNSRHITGAYSIEDLNWDASRQVLRGISNTVPGETYRLAFFVPPVWRLKQLSAESAGRKIALEHRVEGDALTLAFAGVEAPVRWEIGFAR